MFTGWNRFIAALMMFALLTGCGGGTNGTGTTGLSVRGKIRLADGTSIPGASVKLYKTSYVIHSYSSASGSLYSTKDSSGVDSISRLDSVVQSVSTDQNGNYAFNGVQSGRYSIKPTPGSYVYKWSRVPTRDNIGVLTITDSGIVYIYNPEGSGSKLSSDGTIIYNIGTPFTITGNELVGQDFEASVPGGF